MRLTDLNGLACNTLLVRLNATAEEILPSDKLPRTWFHVGRYTAAAPGTRVVLIANWHSSTGAIGHKVISR